MNKIIFTCLISIILICGCSTVRRATADSIPQSLQLSGSDITVGEVLIAEMKYNAKDTNLREQLIAQALRGTDYDFLIMPSYEIIKEGRLTKIRIRGKGAKVKSR